MRINVECAENTTQDIKDNTPTKGWFLTISISASPTGVTLIAPYTGTADFFFME